MSLFNYAELKRLKDLEELVGKLSHKIALLQNDIHSIRVDIADEKRRIQNGM